MADDRAVLVIQPDRALGWICLGASLYAILTRLKSQPELYPKIDLTYSATEPILEPVILSLPDNGIRLRFGGPDQRLRLIEIIDFSKSTFTYKNIELVRRGTATATSGEEPNSGPSFKHLYNRLFGPAYPGEYIEPSQGESSGTYVLSWPGLAARFSIRHQSWSERADFVTLLSSSATSPAKSLAIFSGLSWPEARSTLYALRSQLPKNLPAPNKPSESVPDEIEEIVVYGTDKIEIYRRNAPVLALVLHETTPQDLVADLGPPDAIYRKSHSGLSIHAAGVASTEHRSGESPRHGLYSNGQERAPTPTYTDDSENEVANAIDQDDGNNSSESFYNYFHHGFDALVSAAPSSDVTADYSNEHSSSEFVVTKVFCHSNVPGSYSFNRHRRCRWRIILDDNGQSLILTSEMKFSEISEILKDLWHGKYKSDEDEKRMHRGMVLNRGWGAGDSPESSIELLGGFEQGPSSQTMTTPNGDAMSIPNMDNTELFGFPGLLFEVLKNDTISCLTIYKPS